ncbi:MAG: hypothetical protein JXR69_05185 [Candidatus Delongbacteria bacterium]|nr:hypothetical protein [Candidatus Delongbacteria bacterium]
MLKKTILTLSMVILLTITVLSCSDDSNPSDPVESYITILSPVGGEIFMPDSTESLLWEDNIDENVKIDLYKNSVLDMVIAESVESSGSYDWKVPSGIEEGTDYKIRIASVEDSTLYDESGTDFKITSVSSIIVTEPSGGEIWNVGGQRSIKWNFNSKGLVNIDLYKNDTFYQTIKDSADNNGVYEWYIPAELPQDNDYKIKITNVTDEIITDMSDEFFSMDLPEVYIYDTSDIIANSEYKVQWYGNSNDSTNLSYFYCISTDTAMTNTESETALTGLWSGTSNNYAEVSFPMTYLNSTKLFTDSITYIDSVQAIEVTRKIVWSKFFVYGVDEFGAVSDVKSKVFGRMNNKPKHPMIYSETFGINGFDQYWFTIGPDSAKIVLPNETSYWKPLEFGWMGEDPDGPEVDLEFRWELWALDDLGADIEIIAASNDWSVSNISVEFSDVIYNYSSEGNYSFRIWVRDDALEEAENHATVNFSTFSPTFEKGIIFIDDTDDDKYNSMDYMQNTGNPDGVAVKAMYEQFLQNAGYQADAGDPLLDYDAVDFAEPIPGEVYQPDLKTLSGYRMIVITTEDRSTSTGISYAKYMDQLSEYMNIGGKVMIIGNSAILLHDLYVNNYEEPFTDNFENASYLNIDMCRFFYEYFGIYNYSTPESKTFFCQLLYDIGHPLLPSDYYMTDNYDFIGATKYDHISDPGIGELKVDSTQVNKYWKNYPGPGGSTFEFTLKENGTVLTGIPTFQAYKGEIVLKYKSIYDLPFETGSDSTTVDGDLVHDLKWRNPVADATENISGPVLEKSGAVATRYISTGDIYRTAFIGLPLIFMDNSNGEVSDMFSAMIDWFALENDPADNWK